MTPIVYNFDSHQSIRIFELDFKDSSNLFTVIPESFNALSLHQRLQTLIQVQKILDVTAGKGYLSSIDLSTYPLYSELLPYFITELDPDKSFLWINGDNSMETFKWLYNLMILNLYFLCLTTLKSINLLTIEYEDFDVITDLKLQEKMLLSKLDPAIRYYLRKIGLKMFKNSYIGFDTEYCQGSRINTNELVSVQLALASRIYLQVPKNPEYSISKIDVDRNKIIKLSQKSSVLNWGKFEASMQYLIKEIKRVKFGRYDEMMLMLEESLKLIKGLNYMESEEYCTFSLPRSSIQPYVFFEKEVSLEDILTAASRITTPVLNEQYNALITLVRLISSKDLTLSQGKDFLWSEIHKHFHNYEDIAKQIEGVNKILPNIFHTPSTKKVKRDKRLTREYLSNLF